MRRSKTGLALIAVLAMVLASCGGGGTTDTTADGGSDPGTTVAGPGTTTGETPATTAPPAEMKTDIGVTEDTITLGLLADLTGPFSALVQDITAATEVYFDGVNAAGGIAGREVELEICDTAYDKEKHAACYAELEPKVLGFTQSTGSPRTTEIKPQLLEDNVLVIPLSWYSGWLFPSFDEDQVLEQQISYCLEGMNMIEWMSEKFEADNGKLPTLAIVTRPGEYGEDSGVGAELAAEALGLEVVLEGRGILVGGADLTPIATQIAQANADITWVTGSPTEFAGIVGTASQQGYAGIWSGAVPSYDFRLLDTPIAPILDSNFYVAAYTAPWGNDVDGMDEVITAMTEARPDLRPSDAMILGWLEAQTFHTILEAAAASGDMTREGFFQAAEATEGLDFGGLAPAQSYAGEPNDYATRASGVVQPNLEAYTAAGGADQTLAGSEGGGTTGGELVADFAVGDLAAAYEFTEPCFVAPAGG